MYKIFAIEICSTTVRDTKHLHARSTKSSTLVNLFMHLVVLQVLDILLIVFFQALQTIEPKSETTSFDITFQNLGGSPKAHHTNALLIAYVTS